MKKILTFSLVIIFTITLLPMATGAAGYGYDLIADWSGCGIDYDKVDHYILGFYREVTTPTAVYWEVLGGGWIGSGYVSTLFSPSGPIFVDNTHFEATELPPFLATPTTSYTITSTLPLPDLDESNADSYHALLTVIYKGPGASAESVNPSLTLVPRSPPDTTKPTVISVSPSGTGKALQGDLVITFSEPMLAAPGNITLTGGAGTVSAAGSWDGTEAVYTVGYSGLTHNTTYTVVISGFRDKAGNEMTPPDPAHSFTTVDLRAQPVITPDPADQSIVFPLGVALSDHDFTAMLSDAKVSVSSPLKLNLLCGDIVFTSIDVTDNTPFSIPLRALHMNSFNPGIYDISMSAPGNADNHPVSPALLGTVTVTGFVSIDFIDIPAYLQAGTSVQMIGKVTEHTANGLETNGRMIWSISENSSANTKISAEGLLTIGEDEQAKSIRITVVSADYPTIMVTTADISIRPAERDGE